MAGSVQISSSVFQLNFSAKLKVSAPKSATTQSRQTLAAISPKHYIKLNFRILTFLFSFLILSCNEKKNEKTIDNQSINWEEIEINTRTEKINISKFSDSAEYIQDLNNIAFKILNEDGTVTKEEIIRKKIVFTKSEKDSLVKYIYNSVTNPKFSNVLATDYAGTVQLTLSTGTTKLVCEYHSVGDWSIVSDNTRKIYELLSKKVRISKS